VFFIAGDSKDDLMRWMPSAWTIMLASALNAKFFIRAPALPSVLLCLPILIARMAKPGHG
jgi:hypothetical protein